MLHGRLAHLADPEDAWAQSPTTVTDADLLEAAVVLLAWLLAAVDRQSEED